MMIIPIEQQEALLSSEQISVAVYRDSLADFAMEMLKSVGNLHRLMGGKQHRCFLLGFFTLEPAVLLGMYLLSANFEVSLTE